MILEKHDGVLALAAAPSAPSSLSTLTCHEPAAFQVLWRRYREGQDLRDARELAHLRFLRWVRNAGRLES